MVKQRKKPVKSAAKTTRRPRTKSKRRPKATSGQQVRQGVWSSLLFLYRIGMIFLFLVMFGFFFWLYMAKERQFIEFADEISMLRIDVQELRSQTSRRKAQIEREHHRIERLARQELGLINALEAPVQLVVDREKLIYYDQKDAQMD